MRQPIIMHLCTFLSINGTFEVAPAKKCKALPIVGVTGVANSIYSWQVIVFRILYSVILKLYIVENQMLKAW